MRYGRMRLLRAKMRGKVLGVNAIPDIDLYAIEARLKELGDRITALLPDAERQRELLRRGRERVEDNPVPAVAAAAIGLGVIAGILYFALRSPRRRSYFD
jgi:hypothetical protein